MAWRFYTAAGEEKQAAFPPSADVSFGGYKATLLGDPTSPQDAATKAYVDSEIIPPLFTESTLPALPDAAYPDGTIATMSWSGIVYVVRATGGVWYAMGPPFSQATSVSALASGTGWRTPTAAPAAVTLPLEGSYLVWAIADVQYSAAESVGGIGVAGQNVAPTASPGSIIGTSGQNTIGYRVNLQAVPSRYSAVKGTNEVLTLRANTNVASTITFARAAIYAQPVYLYGEA